MAASNHKINSAISVVQSLDDRPQLGTTAALKKKFDDGPDSIRLKHNDLCDYIDTSIATKTELQGITQGQILDGSITPPKLSFDPATQGELDTVNSNLTTSISTTNDNLNTHMANTSKHLSIMTTQGDTIYQGASAPARLAKGTGYQSYNMNAGATAPQWMESLQSLMTAQGDIIYASAPNTPARFGKGSANQKLGMNSAGTGLAYSDDINYVAGNTITILSAPTERSTSIIGDTAIKTFRVKQGGSYRVSCQIKNGANTGSNLAYGKVFVNGVQAIQWSSTYNATYTTFTYDTAVIPANSTIYITLYTNDSARPAWIKNATITVDNITTDPQVLQD